MTSRGGRADHALAHELDPPAGRFQITCHHVDEGRLAGAIRTDNADCLADIDRNVDIMSGYNAPEILFEIVNFKYAGHRFTSAARLSLSRFASLSSRRLRNSLRIDQRPSGRNIMISRSDPPRISCQSSGANSNA